MMMRRKRSKMTRRRKRRKMMRRRKRRKMKLRMTRRMRMIIGRRTVISMETQTMMMKTMMGKGNMRMMVGGQMMSSTDARTKPTLRGAMMLMKTASRNVKEATYPTMMMTGTSMRDHNNMKVQQMTTCQLMKEQHASTTLVPADH
jgi:hypothetical protein